MCQGTPEGPLEGSNEQEVARIKSNKADKKEKVKQSITMYKYHITYHTTIRNKKRTKFEGDGWQVISIVRAAKEATMYQKVMYVINDCVSKCN